MTNTGSGSFSNSFAFIIEDNLLAYRELVLRYSQAPVTIPKGTVISSGGTPSPYIYFLLVSSGRPGENQHYQHPRV